MSAVDNHFENLKVDVFKKKKAASQSHPYSRHNESKFLKYKNTDKYAKIVAKSNALLSTPKIFQLKFHNNNNKEDKTTNFIYEFLTSHCLDSDIRNRFEFFPKRNGSIAHKEPEEFKEQNVEVETQIDDLTNIESPVKRKKKQKSPSVSCVESKREKKKDSELNETLESEEGSPGIDNEPNDIKDQVDTYQTLLNKGLIFHMQHPCSFSFHGEMKVTLISGEIEILGFNLSESSIIRTVEVFSPNFCSALVIQSNSPKQVTNSEDLRNTLSNVLQEVDISNILAKRNPNDSILLLEQIDSKFGIAINKYCSQPLFPKDLVDVSSQSKTLKELQCTFNFTTSTKSKAFRKNDEWDKIPLSQCTVLCGGKGVGKSTLLKYYLNKSVQEGEKVLCLDFDPGQPEFTAPGCVSAVIIDKPLLGPNFTHVTNPKLMLYYGEIDVCQSPAKYLECVNYVIKSCRENEELSKMKWFVNTMGFAKGLGVDLMISILKLLNPSTVIQINSSDYKKNYPFYLAPVTVNSKTGFKSMWLENNLVFYDLRVITSCVERDGKLFQGGLKPRALRDIMAISYFSQMLSPPYYNFNAVQPYLISFSEIYLGIEFLISPQDILKAFNGNTVSLSHIEPNCEDILQAEATDDYFKIVVKPSVTPCYGLGFVRGIDCKEKKFYIMTHLSIEELDGVNCLSLEKISPPHSMFLKQDAVEGQMPYTIVSTIDTIQRVKRMFRVPQNANK